MCDRCSTHLHSTCIVGEGNTHRHAANRQEKVEKSKRGRELPERITYTGACRICTVITLYPRRVVISTRRCVYTLEVRPHARRRSNDSNVCAGRDRTLFHHGLCVHRIAERFFLTTPNITIRVGRLISFFSLFLSPNSLTVVLGYGN